jgi:hypothetical protein
MNPFKHRLIFFYRGKLWKAFFNEKRDPTILRKQTGEDPANFELTWSVARGDPDPGARAVLGRAREALTAWGWPSRVDLTKPLAVDWSYAA